MGISPDSVLFIRFSTSSFKSGGLSPRIESKCQNSCQSHHQFFSHNYVRQTKTFRGSVCCKFSTLPDVYSLIQLCASLRGNTYILESSIRIVRWAKESIKTNLRSFPQLASNQAISGLSVLKMSLKGTERPKTPKALSYRTHTTVIISLTLSILRNSMHKVFLFLCIFKKNVRFRIVPF